MRAVLAFVVAALVAATAFAQPINERPMYGGVPKTPEMIEADQRFVASVLAAGFTRESGARAAVQSGWREFGSGNAGAAMRRFNQAWLLDPENGDAYHGFAVISADRGEPPTDIEKLFAFAVAKPRVSSNAHTDYARFLNMTDRPDAAIERAKTALTLHPRAPNARLQIAYAFANKRDLAEACRWAREATDNGDDIYPPDLVRQLCDTGAR